ncbi:hypothetical protein G7054_g7725 [Neopestalotiopsis clavispora]|nr:hypothetical protein G7054_g7725 [Neopestalotiopsis clavispora]
MTISKGTHPLHADKFGTLAVHAGSPVDPVTGAVITPISLSSTFAQSAVGVPTGAYEYSRAGNPNRHHLETAIAVLEQARYALAFSSGSAATAVIIQSLPIGSHVLSIGDVYGGTHRYFTRVANTHGVNVTFTTDLVENAAACIHDNTRLIWIETPTNPTLRLTDIQRVCDIAHTKDVIVVVDNTFMSPAIQNPLLHGADMVMHSATKYINGHSDVVMGVVALNCPELHHKLAFLQNAIGAVPSPFDCWLAHRGLKTLNIRSREATYNASIIARALEACDEVISVNYPGLESSPDRTICQKQHRDGMGGGMVSFRIRGGKVAAERFCALVRIATLAESLGGIESLVEVPASMTHAGIPTEQREKSGVYDDLIRLSCGIEDAEDLKADIMQAIKGATTAV